MSTDKVKIELTPHQAMEILSFLREFDYTKHPLLASLGETIDEYQRQVEKNITVEQLDDATAQMRVNQLLGKSPD